MVDNQRAISQVPEQDAEELLAGTKLLLGSLSVLNVSKVHDDGGNIRVMAGVTQYRLHPSGFAPASSQPEFDHHSATAAVQRIKCGLEIGRIIGVHKRGERPVLEPAGLASEELTEVIGGVTDPVGRGVEHGDGLVPVAQDRPPVGIGSVLSGSSLLAHSHIGSAQDDMAPIAPGPMLHKCPTAVFVSDSDDGVSIGKVGEREEINQRRKALQVIGVNKVQVGIRAVEGRRRQNDVGKSVGIAQKQSSDRYGAKKPPDKER